MVALFYVQITCITIAVMNEILVLIVGQSRWTNQIISDIAVSRINCDACSKIV